MKKFLLFFLIIVSLAIFDIAQAASCQESRNVWGWAWMGSPQSISPAQLGLGWLSFSCKNCNTTPRPANCPAGNIEDYGVHICQNDTDPFCTSISAPKIGKMLGYAWSENIGLISFNESELGGCPSAPCRAWVDTLTTQVNGWARACSVFQNNCSGALKPDSQRGGWDGWIKLSSALYQTRIDNSTSPSQFRGWAWGSDVVGWASFNCINQGVCASSDYKVFTTFSVNAAPTVTNMQSDASGADNYCNIGPGLGISNFSWQYSDSNGDPQTRYDFQVDNHSGFASPEVDRSFAGLSNPSPTTNNQSVQIRNVATAPGGDYLTYNTPYYWRVRVYDNQGNNSGWVQGPNFTTDTHPWPWIDFSWAPNNPPLNTPVQFTDNSQVFGGASKSSWSWVFENGNPATSNLQNPIVEFTARGSDNKNTVTLTVRDSSGKACTADKKVSVTLPLPGWIEIPPR